MRKYIINPDVFFKKINNHIVILKQGEHFCRELNETASFIWKLLESNKNSTSDIVELLTKEYKISKAAARKDLESFVKKYLRLKILVESK